MNQITARKNGFISTLTRFFITFFLAITFLGTLSSASPVGGIEYARAPDACPSTAEIATYLKQHTKVGDNTVFYSAPVPSRQASDFAKTKHGHSYPDLINNEILFHFLDLCGHTPAEQDKLIPRISEAIAEASTGTAYVLISGKQPPKEGSIWVKVEFPALKRNHNIHEVIQHDVDHGHETVIYRKE